MVSFFPAFFCFKTRKLYVGFLAFAWLLGLILGSFAGLFADESFYGLLQVASAHQISQGGFPILTILLLLLSCFALRNCQYWIVLILAVLKAFCLSLISCGLAVVYGSAGWFVTLLFLFPDFFCVPLLLWYWICIPFSSKSTHLPGAFLLSGSLILCYLNDQYVSPFLAELITI